MKKLALCGLLTMSFSAQAMANSTLCGWFGTGEGMIWLTDKNASGQLRYLDFTGKAYTKGSALLQEIFDLNSRYSQTEPVSYVTSTFYEAATHFCACFKAEKFDSNAIYDYDSKNVKFQDPGVCYADLGRP